jgi:hypothetical protein
VPKSYQAYEHYWRNGIWKNESTLKPVFMFLLHKVNGRKNIEFSKKKDDPIGA